MLNSPQPNQPLKSNLRARFRPNNVIHIKRSLVNKGKILVSRGEEIEPQDIIGKATRSAGYSSINLAEKLGVSNSSGAQYLKKEIGSKIFKGELLAQKNSFWRKTVVVAPTDGVIETYDQETGRLLLKFFPKEIPLTAGVYGVVDFIDNKNGDVLIRTMATEVFGMIGSGKQRSGILRMIGDRGSLVKKIDITPDLLGHVVMAGALIYGEAIRQAVNLGAMGIISGGLNMNDYYALTETLDFTKKQDKDFGISILATEGFGPLPIGDDLYQILSSHQDQYVFISGNTPRLLLPNFSNECMFQIRKTALPIVGENNSERMMAVRDLKIGSKIRIISSPFMSSQGVVVAIDGQPTLLPSGISTICLLVDIGSQKIKVPFTNVELII